MKIKLPGLNGNMSVNLPFLLLAVAELSTLEAVLIACLATAVQSVPRHDCKLKPIQMLFNVSMMAVACGLAGLVFHPPSTIVNWVPGSSLLLVPSAVMFFLGQTVPVATIITLTEGGAIRRVWLSIAQLSFPYFTLSAGLTSTVVAIGQRLNWRVPLFVLPVMYCVYRSFAMYFRHQGDAKPSLAMAARAGK
jgi:hypothetical protein